MAMVESKYKSFSSKTYGFSEMKKILNHHMTRMAC